jgi:hypothetical protein
LEDWSKNWPNSREKIARAEPNRVRFFQRVLSNAGKTIAEVTLLCNPLAALENLSGRFALQSVNSIPEVSQGIIAESCLEDVLQKLCFLL